ncbi:glycerophosphoryl diester phosphodiesterase [Kribbella flavida DSM 17836]|uniref:Glycerophosphoryl diester phosphodiesterase n=1 Tax=Kribbella flavida (strain DSM 17836 / JCM 10339 / NBRC 14399) TaxID=479435 RepID=D2PQU8_KRIFD|nr:glycerophosphodiester phosphodiesterase [Kribbella flavida]ADB31081.1 glycerophosphoryl diester phosphodiesterase [Kribbella flavida DSM 17836]
MSPRVFSRPATLVGHRGLGKGVVQGHRENTAGSFLGAVDAGLRWVEVDVRRTLDDELFVVHDAALSDGRFLAELTGAQAERYGALPVHRLLDVLPPEVGVVFDVKSSLEDAGRPADSTTAALLGTVATESTRRRPTLAQSFDPAALRQLRQAAPRVPLGLLTWLHFPIGQAVAAAAHLDIQVLAVHAGSLWPTTAAEPRDVPSLDRIVALVHGADRELLVWCPTAEQARHLVTAEVDAIVIDDVPAQVHQLSAGCPA